MEKFLETYNLPELNQEESESLNIPITNMEIERVIRKLPTKKNLKPNDFTGEFFHTFKNPYQSFLNTSKK